MINGWLINSILPPGESANTYELDDNCYYCTAAALQNKDCKSLVETSEHMQYKNGDASDFKALFDVPIQHKRYDTLQSVTRDLLSNLRPHRAVAFGYNRTNGTGHMIVVFKARSKGSVHIPAWRHLRHIDYQTRNPHHQDGILPSREKERDIREYHIMSLL